MICNHFLLLLMLLTISLLLGDVESSSTKNLDRDKRNGIHDFSDEMMMGSTPKNTIASSYGRNNNDDDDDQEEHLHLQRKLNDRSIQGLWERFKESCNRLAETPVDKWEAGQWMFALALLTLFLWCCGCISCNRRRRYYRNSGPSSYPMMGGGGYYGGGGYGYGGGGYRSGGGSGLSDCLRNLICCFCCYEFFCADCQHVPCFRHSSYGGGGGENFKIGKNDDKNNEENYNEMV